MSGAGHFNEKKFKKRLTPARIALLYVYKLNNRPEIKMNDYIVFFALNGEVNHRYISCNSPEKAKWAVKVKHPEATGIDVFDANEYDQWIESLNVIA